MTNDTQKMLTELEKQLTALRQRLDAEQRREPPTARVKASILDALKVKGPMTIEQLCGELRLTKGTVWRRVDDLEREARVWLRVTHEGKTGRKHTVVYHADAIAT